jgi:hypothetical protein
MNSTCHRTSHSTSRTNSPLFARPHRACATLALVAAATLNGGCNNAGEGALSGAALGALGGMGIGSLYGEMGKGAAMGGIIGGIGGLILGDQNARNMDY